MPRRPVGAAAARPLRHNSRKTNTKSGAGGAKIVIRPYSKPPQLPDNYYEKTSQQILNGLLSVLDKSNNNNKSQLSDNNLSLQSANNNITDLVRHKFGDRLFADLVMNMQHAAELVLPATNNTNSASDMLLQYCVTQYQQYTEYLMLLKHVCLPLDRSWQWQWNMNMSTTGINRNNNTYNNNNILPNTGKAVPITSSSGANSTKYQNLWQVGLSVFLQRLQSQQLDTKLYEQWLQAFLNDWNAQGSGAGECYISSTNYLQQVWYVWQDLNILGQLPIQHDLEQYWTQQSEQWKANAASSSNTYAAAFLQFCHAKHNHCQTWRPWLPITWLWSILDNFLFAPHLNDEYLLHDSNINPVLSQAIFQNNATSMQQLWTMAGRLPNGIMQISQLVQKFVKENGLQRMSKPNTAVPDLLSLQENVRSLFKQLNNAEVSIPLKSVYEDIVNVEASPSLAEQLAKFLDMILRSNKKVDTYNNDQDWLQKIIAGLFVPLQAKDVFEAFYKRCLAKRLLLNRVVSMDIEKQVCSLLKAECGACYTSKMEGMFQDVEWSQEYKKTNPITTGLYGSGSLEFEAQVLTTGYWPVYPQYPNLQLPTSLQELQEQFGNHYKTKYQGRRMTWQYALGHCVVRANGFNKPYDLIVSLCQALVLLQFTSAETSLSLPELMTAVGLEERDEMERILQSLSVGKDGTRILRKIDFDAEKKKKTRLNVDDKDTFIINNSFESNSRRIRITNIMMKESKEERDKTVEGVSRDRLYLIDAVLVRIMKARKTISHKALIPQVLEQIKFPAQAVDVKKRIESLIEREYMERDSADRSRYNYMA